MFHLLNKSTGAWAELGNNLSCFERKLISLVQLLGEMGPGLGPLVIRLRALVHRVA